MASTLRSTIRLVDFLWLGHTAQYVKDDVVAVWHTNIDAQVPSRHPPIPEFHPLSLKYVWSLILYYLGYLDPSTAHTIRAWKPFLPRVYNDRLIVYYSREYQWLSIVNSESDWNEHRSQLRNWIEEHRGKLEDDATFNVINILNKEEDITVELFPFISPTGNFISRDHLDMLLTDTIVTEDIDGNRIEIWSLETSVI